ncbi:MATE family efflux transporter [Psychrobium sp. 1_MG-2023]|uniref:MATE family efflux transporter n=1 Tax=Psychrobium sp. 1_MG-2023 TaxID=3062624 RepID=UPI000C323D9A|nr:MATE family efflux transporter [Psychrobium sp. 1_MG-2023]MDP2559556.1 MATE family efflux transporter [Psychrobium sp. 1_MG-2023]PKF59394.1 MATE family efflux transporter [Alteromonadales bacterium alter-6D02]
MKQIINKINTAKHRIEAKTLLKLAVPAILAQVAQMSLGVIDTIMAGRYSADALAAIAIGVSIFNPIIVFIIGIFLALSPITAQFNGEENKKGVRQAFQSGIVLAVLLALPSSLLLTSLEPLLWQIGITEKIIPLTSGYLEALAWGLIPLYCFFALRFCNEGMFATKAIMYCSIAAIPFNVVCNYWFINGGWGLAPMGAVGVGWATVVVWCVMALSLISYTALAKRYHGYHLFTHWIKPKLKTYSEVFKIGLPMGIGLGMEVALFGAVGLMIGRYSVPEIAGHQIALNISSMAYTISLGLSVAVTARVGYHIGKKDRIQARDTGYMGIGFGVIISCVTAIAMVLFNQQLAQIFTADTQVITVAVQLLILAAIFQLSDGIQVNASGALRGMKDTKVPMLICTVAYWVIGFPVGYIFAEHFGMGVRGYWLAIITGLTLSAILMTRRFYQLVRVP